MRFTSLLVGVGDRRQPTPNPSQPTPSPSQEGRGRQETGDNPPLTPPRRGVRGMSEKVGFNN
ncbi:MAG: hypothetical protein F6K48_21050 [Okeania sp. SIO3H1]|nr:hypothetical protein [Okeania sp. SIO3H1]